MTNKTSALVLMLMLLPLSAWTQAQTIWRCGADGSSYSATPCTEGRALVPAAVPSAAEQAQARQVALADARLAAHMRNDRLLAEARTQPAALSAGAQAPAPGVNKKPLVASTRNQAVNPRRPAAAGTWRATGPSSRRAKG